MPSAFGCPFRVNRVTLTVGRPLPVYPDQRAIVRPPRHVGLVHKIRPRVGTFLVSDNHYIRNSGPWMPDLQEQRWSMPSADDRDSKPVLACSRCGRRQHDISDLADGPAAFVREFICEECVS